jgi:uncharacterized membrane protein YgcG
MKLRFKLLAALVVANFLMPGQIASADVNDFSFESFDAVYELSQNKDFDNRPEIHVTETIVAIFPEINQNRGIKRSIPSSSYGVYPGLIEIHSVTDENGADRDYEVIEEEGFNNIYIKKDDDSFVNGRQTYVIEYTQSWVIRNFQASSGNDEFYWDVNGTGWLQSFGRVSASVKVDKELQSNLLTSAVSCYQGLSGSTNSCEVKQLSADQMYFAASNLMPGENLTISIPFTAGAVNTSGPNVDGSASWIIYQIAALLALLVLAWAVYFRIYRIRSRGKNQFTVPEYKPAATPTLLDTSIISRKSSHLIQALIVELAVKQQIEIEAVTGDDKSFILRRTSSALDQDGVMAALGLSQSGAETRIGSSADDAQNQLISVALQKLIAGKVRAVNSGGYFSKRALGLPALGWLVGLALYIVWIIVALQLDQMTGAGYVAAPILSFLPFSAVYWLLVSKRSYTAKGSSVISHLKGLDMYIELAEKDRLEFLQSPKGALLKPSELTGKQVLKLYEEVLPWAILLGLQKQWGEVLTELYREQGSPSWFSGAPFMTQSLSSVGQALSSSLATSSSGGSSGSGSSGGGGGGGGGSGI